MNENFRSKLRRYVYSSQQQQQQRHQRRRRHQWHQRRHYGNNSSGSCNNTSTSTLLDFLLLLLYSALDRWVDSVGCLHFFFCAFVFVRLSAVVVIVAVGGGVCCLYVVLCRLYVSEWVSECVPLSKSLAKYALDFDIHWYTIWHDKNIYIYLNYNNNIGNKHIDNTRFTFYFKWWRMSRRSSPARKITLYRNAKYWFHLQMHHIFFCNQK